MCVCVCELVYDNSTQLNNDLIYEFSAIRL